MTWASEAQWLLNRWKSGPPHSTLIYQGELKIGFLFLMRFYKGFISPNDSHTCNFTLSCSAFSLRAVEKFGLLKGLLLTSDRLQRCIYWAREYYPLDFKTGLAIDYPLSWYNLR